VLFVDVNALLTVHGENALRQIVLHSLDARNSQNVMRVQRAIGDGIALLHALAVLNLEADGIRDLILLDLAVISGDRNVAKRGSVGIVDVSHAVDFRNLRHLLGLSCLEQFLDSGKTLRDIVARDAAGVEGSHRQLRTGFADGLRGDDADRFAGVHKLGGCEVHAVALRAHAGTCLAAEHRADIDLVDAVRQELLRVVLAEHDVLGVQELTCLRVGDVVYRIAAADAVCKGVNQLTLFIVVALPAAVR